MRTISYAKSRQKLAVLWLIWGAFLFLLVALQTFGGKHGTDVQVVWDWLLGAIVPTLSLMVGVFVADFGKSDEDDKQIKPFFYRLAFGFSLFYLLMVTALILGQPVSGKLLKELIDDFSRPLQAVQGLAGLVLGIFFVKS